MVIFNRFNLNAKACSSPLGFTLVELSVTLLLITLILTLAVPRFSDLTQVELRSSSRRLAAMMRYLYAEAAFRKTYFSLVYDLEKGEYWVEAPQLNPLTQEVELLEVENLTLARHQRLPHGIKLSDVKIGNGEKVKEKRANTWFYPGGYADPTTIHLKDRRGREYSIFLIPVSGRVLVREGYYEFAETGN